MALFKAAGGKIELVFLYFKNFFFSYAKFREIQLQVSNIYIFKFLLKVTTSNGCIHLDQSYGIGLFDQGCEERCQCFPNGTVQCDTRCQPPLHPIGSTAGDKHCVEQKVPGGDECCVRGKITLGYKKS